MRDVEQTLSERYAAPPAWRRPATVAAIVVVAVVALAWLAWAAFVEATPEVESNLLGYEVIDAHSATARIDVTIHDAGSHPTCTVQALASDHSIVGELTFAPRPGSNTVTVRTEREATAVDVPGCIADGQDHPR
jgi:Domain of unknown function (DUF4307)